MEEAVLEVHVAGVSPIRCPWCHDEVALAGGEWVACGACLARHHSECWGEAAACASCREKVPLSAVGVLRAPRRRIFFARDAGARRDQRRYDARMRRLRMGIALGALVVVDVLILIVIVFAEGSAVATFNYSIF